MAEKAGALLWNRVYKQLAEGTQTVNTGLKQPNTGFGDYSPGEPPLAGSPDPGGVGSRIQVIPMSPLTAWAGVRHGEPQVNEDGEVEVTFEIPDGGRLLNVLFWDPHSMIGPGAADPYTEVYPD
jgi:hypothetical protein